MVAHHGRVGQIDDESAVVASGGGRYRTELRADWNIGDNPNGGYAMLPVLRALVDATGRPDPLSVTVHYLRPALGGTDGEIETQIVREGRSATFASGSLVQDGAPRLAVAAVLGDLSVPASDVPDPSLTASCPGDPDTGGLRRPRQHPAGSRVAAALARRRAGAPGSARR